MKSTKYSDYCLKTLGRFFVKQKEGELEEKNLLLEKANIEMEYEEYYAMVIMNIILSFIITLISTVLLYVFIPNIFTMSLIFLLTSGVTIIIGLTYLYLPQYYIKNRGKSIDKFLPYALNFISSMAVAGVSPAEIFQTLSTIDVYGEVQTEAKRIAKEIKIMGIDNISALKHAIELSPSYKFKNFLQGMIGTIQSGSDLHEYLKIIVNNYLQEDIVERKRNLELLNIIAESFVIAVIAFPIFLVIILSTMGFFGGSLENSVFILLLFTFLVLPLTYVTFYYLVSSTTIEALIKTKRRIKYTVRDFYRDYKSVINILLISVVILIAAFITIYILAFYDFLESNIYLYVDFAFLGFLLLLGPVCTYLHSKTKIRKEIQNRLPDFFTEVGDSLNSGMNAFEAVKVAERGRYGRLGPEIKKMKSQLSWNISIRNVFQNFANRMRSGIINRVIVTINEGLIMGGNTGKIFKAASTEIGQVNQIDRERRANMTIYMIIILLCFFVFLGIILIIDKTIFSSFYDIQLKQLTEGGFEEARDVIRFNLIDPIRFRYTLLTFVYVQSIGAGMLAGYMIDGKVSSGARYSVVLAIISFVVFKLFVL
jgi:flagellar protein FlaJ